MLYEEPKGIHAEDIDIDAYVAHLINDSFADLIKEVKSNFTSWKSAGYYIESYLADKQFELLDLVIGSEKDAKDPMERDAILRICASKLKNEDKQKKVTELTPVRDDVDWDSVTKRAAVVLTGMDRSAVVATLVSGDRLWDEYQIIARKFKLIDKNAVAQTNLYVSSVNKSVGFILRALDHALFLKLTDRPTVILTKDSVMSAFPKPELFDEVVDAAIECLNYVGIFIPIVQKTISEQRNPYMLYDFTQDLVLLFGLIEKKGGTLTEKEVREGVAQFGRQQELKERTIVWMQTYLTEEYINQQLSRPFARKIKEVLDRDGLGRGTIITLLKDKIAKSSLRVKWEAALIVDQILRNAHEVTVAGTTLPDVRARIVFTKDPDSVVDYDATATAFIADKLLEEGKEFTKKDQLQMKELASIMLLIQTFTR